MSWVTQGRQYHGWFGHGTADGDGKADAKAMALTIGYSVVGHLHKAQRGRYESWLGQGGVDTLAEVLPGWVAGAAFSAEHFHKMVVGEGASSAVAARAQEVGRALESRGDSRLEVDREAGQRFAALVETVRLDALGRVMKAAAQQAGTSPVRALVQAAAQRTTTRSGSRPASAAQLAAARARRNLDNLTTVLFNEGRREGREAMVAVGHVLRNRMLRNNVPEVFQVWGGFSRKPISTDGKPDKDALAIAKEVASGVLLGRTPDPTNGATHFYSPRSMPKEGEDLSGFDVGPEVEDIPGVYKRDPLTKARTHVRNHFPPWSRTYEPRLMPTLPEHQYKFFKQPEGTGRVQ